MRFLPYQPIPASRAGFQTRRIQIDCSISAATRTRQDENPALPTDFFVWRDSQPATLGSFYLSIDHICSVRYTPIRVAYQQPLPIHPNPSVIEPTNGEKTTGWSPPVPWHKPRLPWRKTLVRRGGCMQYSHRGIPGVRAQVYDMEWPG